MRALPTGFTLKITSTGIYRECGPGIRLNCVDTQNSRHLILVVMYNEIRQEVQQPPGRSSNPFTLGE